MKASELIKQLQNAIELYGDREVVTYTEANEECSYFSPVTICAANITEWRSESFDYNDNYGKEIKEFLVL